jgi:hypothetical protein
MARVATMFKINAGGSDHHYASYLTVVGCVVTSLMRSSLPIGRQAKTWYFLPLVRMLANQNLSSR